MWKWEWMFQGSVFIAMVLILRLILLDRLPKRAFTVLWTACTIQLLLPVGQLVRFDWWTSVFGLNLAQAGGEAMRRCVEAVVEDTPLGVLPQRLAREACGVLPGFHVRPLLWFWLMGAGGFALAFIFGHLRGRRIYRESLPADDPFVLLWAEENRDWRGVSVRLSDRIAAPLTYGVLRPVVLLPRDMDWENREALSYVLAHEFHHVRRWDALRKWGFAAALCVHWFNPLAWLMYAAANRDLELDCDETAADAFLWGSREGYARTLIAMEERRSFGAPFASYFSRTTLEARVKSLLSRKRCGGARLALAAGVVCVLALVGTSPAASRAINLVEISSGTAPVPTAEPLDPVLVEPGWVVPSEPAASEYVIYGYQEQTAVTGDAVTGYVTDGGFSTAWENVVTEGTAEYAG